MLQRVLRHVGLLEPGDHVVAQGDGVGDGLEGHRVGAYARQVEVVRHRAEGEHQVVVGQRLGGGGAAGAQVDQLLVGVDAVDLRQPEPGARAGRPHGHADVVRLERPGRDLGEHRREQQCVAPADDGDVHARHAREQPFEPLGDGDPAEAPAQDHDADTWRGGIGHRSRPRALLAAEVTHGRLLEQQPREGAEQHHREQAGEPVADGGHAPEGRPAVQQRHQRQGDGEPPQHPDEQPGGQRLGVAARPVAEQQRQEPGLSRHRRQRPAGQPPPTRIPEGRAAVRRWPSREPRRQRVHRRAHGPRRRLRHPRRGPRRHRVGRGGAGQAREPDVRRERPLGLWRPRSGEAGRARRGTAGRQRRRGTARCPPRGSAAVGRRRHGPAAGWHGPGVVGVLPGRRGGAEVRIPRVAVHPPHMGCRQPRRPYAGRGSRASFGRGILAASPWGVAGNPAGATVADPGRDLKRSGFTRTTGITW